MIHHVALETRCAEAEAVAGFFALLGFERIDPPEALAGRALWLEHKEGQTSFRFTQIHVLFAEDPVVPSQGHVAVVATDYEAATERLRRAGFAPEQRSAHWGAARCFVLAPGGHRVEIMAAPPTGAGA